MGSSIWKKCAHRVILVILLITCAALLYILYYHSYTLSQGFANSYYKVKSYESVETSNFVSDKNDDAWGHKMVDEIRRQMNIHAYDKHEWKSKLAQQTYSEPDVKARQPEENPKLKWKIIFNLTEPASEQSIDWIQTQGNFLARVKAYNKALNVIRETHITQRKEMMWQDIDNHVDVIWGNRDDFFLALKKYEHIQTIGLPWLIIDNVKGENPNMLLQTYYKWTGSDALCKWINTPGYTKARWDAVYNRSCTTNLDLTRFPISTLEPVYFWGKPINPDHYWPNAGLNYPPFFHTHYPEHIYYIHFIEDAIVTVYGDVISRNVKIVPYSCSQDLTSVAPPGYLGTPVFDEVFVATQYWADQFFHKSIESLPRIAPYIQFLRENPSIKIHVAENRGTSVQLLQKFDISENRLITGIIRALFLYLPQATPCGFPVPQLLQMISGLYHESLYTLNTSSKEDMRNIILIQRTGWRRFTEAQRIHHLVESIAKEYGFVFQLFSDNPTPSMDTAMSLFYNAALVIAPHGAGLSNLVYSRPGVYVIEGVCNPPHVNMCYQWTSHVLGHRYHGIASQGGCEDFIDVDSTEIDWIARKFLDEMKASYNL